MKLFAGLCNFESLKDLPSTAAQLVVCSPTSLPCVRGAAREHCNFCGGEVWLAPSTASCVSASATIYLACMTCARERFQEMIATLPADAQVQELVEQTGLPFTEVHAVLREAVCRHNRAQKFKSN